MGNLNQIKSKLLEMEGGMFQRLCDDWLHRRGYENINPIGMMAATNRVVKGTPDTLIIQSNGKYVFSEYTVQQNRLAQKLEDDICKCFDESKTGISNGDIGEIIICHLGGLSSSEVNQLRMLCHERGILLSLNGLDTIALSIQNSYPILSEQYLAIPLDTGQLLSVEDFIERYGKNNLTTSIENDILFQDDAIARSISLLRSNNFLLVSGSAGVGKTIFSINLAKELKRIHTNLNVICLFDKGADLIRDVTARFSEPGKYLIFIDDANRLDNRLDYLLHYLHEPDINREFRIIATVRDYARESVVEKAKSYTEVHEQVIKPLSDDQIKAMVETIFGIKNDEYKNRIQEIARGNARLAVMASKVVLKTNQISSIRNVTSLYDDYFGKNDSVKAVVDDGKLMAVACSISFFRKIDKLNETQMLHVQQSFGIQPEEFGEFVSILHKKELVDLYENEVVKISDQILSSYLFYVSVFEKKVIPFSVIVSDFYPNFTRAIIDSLNPVISCFDHKKIVDEIRGEVRAIFEEMSAHSETDELVEFLYTFWFALPTESLVFARNTISLAPTSDIDWSGEVFEESKTEAHKGSLIKLLGNFRHYGEAEFQISFDLLLCHLEKNVDSLGCVIQNLLNHYNFKPDDYQYGYFIQNYVVDKLIERMDEGKNYLFSRLFILVCKAFLKVEYREHRWSRDDTINIITFRLSPDSYILPIREKLIKNLGILVKNDEYKHLSLEQFKEYVTRLRYEGREMARADLQWVSKHFVINLNPSDISNCLIMQDYCENLDLLELEYPIEWKGYLSNDVIILSNLILEDRHERRYLEMGYEEYNLYRHQCLVDYFTGISHDEFSIFIQKLIRIKQAFIGKDKSYSINNGIEKSLRALADAAPSIFPDLVSMYQEFDDIFEVNPHFIIVNLFNLVPTENVWKIVNAKAYKWKQLWRSTYFANLPKEAISKEEVISLIDHFNSVPSNQLRSWLDFLDKFKTVDNEIYAKVVRILVDKSKVDQNYARPLTYLFNAHSELSDNLFDVFKTHEDLVFEAYLAAFNIDKHCDASGDVLSLLTERNFGLLFQVIDQVYEKERWPDVHSTIPEMNFLWTRDAFLEEIELYGKYIHYKEDNLYSSHDNLFSKLFVKVDGQIDSDSLLERKKQFLKYTVERNSNDIKYVCFIFQSANYMSEAFRRELLTVLLSGNSNFEDFKRLDYELVARSWSGSRVPILEREKNFLVSILPIFNSIEFLEHRYYVEKQIEEKVRYIEYEKKRDFLESR